MKVRATQLGYYGNHRRREGDVFVIKPKKGWKVDQQTGKKTEVVFSAEDQFSERWMERFDKAAQAKLKAERLAAEDADDGIVADEDFAPRGEDVI